MGTKPELGGGDFELCPATIHNAICGVVMPLGIRETKFGNKKQVKFIFITEAKDSEGRNFMIFSKPLTLSANKKSSLFQMCKSWGAIPFDSEQGFADIELEQYQGERITINVVHNKDGDNTWVNIDSVMPPMVNNTFETDDPEYITRVHANLKRNSGIFNPDDMEKPESAVTDTAPINPNAELQQIANEEAPF